MWFNLIDHRLITWFMSSFIKSFYHYSYSRRLLNYEMEWLELTRSFFSRDVLDKSSRREKYTIRLSYDMDPNVSVTLPTISQYSNFLFHVKIDALLFLNPISRQGVSDIYDFKVSTLDMGSSLTFRSWRIYDTLDMSVFCSHIHIMIL